MLSLLLQGRLLFRFAKVISQKKVNHSEVLTHQMTTRGVKTLDFAGTKEVVYERSDWPLAKLQDSFKNDTLALIGYGSQGHGQGLNARDNGLNVIVGVREGGESWKQAQEDGWVGSTSLFTHMISLTGYTRYLARHYSQLMKLSNVEQLS